VEGYVGGGVVWVSNISSALFCFYSFLLCIFSLFYAGMFTQCERSSGAMGLGGKVERSLTQTLPLTITPTLTLTLTLTLT
jgi:hypothetical protein